MDFWQNIYSHFNPIAFSVFSIDVHWYGILYAFALISAFFIAKFFINYDKLNIKTSILEEYFIWVEIGVILGARLSYIIFYDTNPLRYLLNPLDIFNPYENGVFKGISGFSYHGSVLGFFIASYLFCKYKKQNFFFWMDLSALSVPLAYFFGRIGNFLNKELIGRETNEPWGIYIDGVLRHPSQIYEAFLEGIVVFIIVFALRKKDFFQGKLMFVYGVSYGLLRYIAELYREPDEQLGFIFLNVTMGQILSSLMIIIGLYFILQRKVSFKYLKPSTNRKFKKR